LFTTEIRAQENDSNNIQQVVNAFAKAADENDTAMIAEVLYSNYRIVMNQLFGNKKASIVSRELHASKVKSKECGDDKRKVNIHNALINNLTTCVKVSFTYLPTLVS
jgi:hypothetical protein